MTKQEAIEQVNKMTDEEVKEVFLKSFGSDNFLMDINDKRHSLTNHFYYSTIDINKQLKEINEYIELETRIINGEKVSGWKLDSYDIF